MDPQQLVAVLFLAFGLGLLHALDADHVMAVSSLAGTRPSVKQSLGFCFRWALGHGSALIFIACLVLFFEVAIPTELSAMAERAVGLILIGLGIWVIFDISRRRIRLQVHKHHGLPRHAHWSSVKNSPDHADQHKHHTANDHGAVLVGVLHGLAGSAPLLAIVPLVKLGNAWHGLLYIGVFCAGVLLSMLLFGGLLGGIYQYLKQWGNKAVSYLRLVIGVSSIAYGSYFLHNL